VALFFLPQMGQTLSSKKREENNAETASKFLAGGDGD